MTAGDLISSFINDPANVLQGGVGSNSRLVLIQNSDVSSYTVSGIDLITAITLAANKQAYVIEGIRQSLKPKWERVAAESGQSVFKHTCEFSYFDYAQISKNNAARIAQGRYMCIVESAKMDKNAIEIYGIDVGLEVQEMSRAHQDLGGAIKIVLASPDKEFEAKPPRTLDGGTGIYITNRTIVDALLFLPTIGVGGLSIVTGAGASANAIVITGTAFFANSANDATTDVSFINQATGAVILFTAARTVTATTITTTTPITAAGQLVKVRVTTSAGVVLSAQNYKTT